MAKKCKYCWRPIDYKADARTEGAFHNEGCPVDEKGPLWEEWQRGYWRGWEWDSKGILPHWLWDRYSKTFILGYRAGKESIDDLVDQVAQAEYE